MTGIGLTTAELADIRTDIADLLPDTCTIEKVSVTTDEIGAEERTYSNRATGVACRFDALSGADEKYGMFGAILETTSLWVVTLPHDTTIISTDRIVHGGNTYDVVFPDTDKSWKGSVRVIVQMAHQ